MNGIGINMIVRLTSILAATLATAACSSPPQAPTVDDSKKRPVNVTQALELQSCRSELVATRIVLNESIDRPRVITVPAKPLDVVPTLVPNTAAELIRTLPALVRIVPEKPVASVGARMRVPKPVF